MRNVANFLLFQLFWFAAVVGASRGWPWTGPIAALVFLGIHLGMIHGTSERLRELRYVLIAGALGTLADTGMRAAGAIVYPSSEDWPLAIVPPFIMSLWVAFAMLPRFSLAWLARRPYLAAALGALGGPLSFLAGTRFDVVGAGDRPLLTWGLLSLEYALVTPLLMHFARPGRGARDAG